MSALSDFGRTARGLSSNALGIIGLFIILIYGTATAVIIDGNYLSDFQRDLFTWFLVIYPVLVLIVFAWLVTRHSKNLYAPRDFKNQADWVELQKAISLIDSAAKKARDEDA
jgi:hypothetical protein